MGVVPSLQPYMLLANRMQRDTYIILELLPCSFIKKCHFTPLQSTNNTQKTEKLLQWNMIYGCLIKRVVLIQKSSNSEHIP